MWEQIQANRRRSTVLVTLMGTLLALMGYAAGELLAGPGAGFIGLFIALAVWGIQMLVYATSAESLLLSGMGARQLQREDSPRLFNIVDEMVIASGLGFTPAVYIIDEPSPNAFAVGRKPENSAVCVTSGLMQRLNRDELQGVIAHEIGHLKNRDVKFMTLAGVMLGSIIILSEIVWRTMAYGGRYRSRSSSRGNGQAQLIIFIIAILVAILGPILAQVLYFACSRKREYLADASAAQFTRYPEGLASALEKISAAAGSMANVSKATAPMFVTNPLYAAGHEPSSLFSTHPRTSMRVTILRSMGGASFSDYEAAARRALGRGGLVGSQSLRESTAIGIREPSSEGPIESRRETRNTLLRTSGYVPITCDCGLTMQVPPQFEGSEVMCIRCGSRLPLPSAVPEGHGAAAVDMIGAAVAATMPPLQYVRTKRGWESFRCSCGSTIQLSPSFSAPHTQCPKCGRVVEIAPAN